MNKRTIISVLVVFSVLLFISSPVLAYVRKEPIQIYYFYSTGCSACARVTPYLDELKVRYKDVIEIHRLDVRESEENREKFFAFLEEYEVPVTKKGSVPAIFMTTSYFIGANDIFQNLEEQIDYCKETDHQTRIPEACEAKEITQRGNLTLPLVLSTALIDSVNPCAIAVLVFLVTFILGIKGSPKRLLKVGLAYILAIFITYYLAGLGLLKVIQVFNVSRYIIPVAAVVVILAGIVNLKDFFFPGKGISLKIPDRTKPFIERFMKRATVPAVFLAGVLVSAFELPCTGEVYLGILSLLSASGGVFRGHLYLLLYNIIFVLPLIVILVFSILGMLGFKIGLDPAKIKSFRESKKRWIRLIMGLIMIILGIYLFILL